LNNGSSNSTLAPQQGQLQISPAQPMSPFSPAAAASVNNSSNSNALLINNLISQLLTSSASSSSPSKPQAENMPILSLSNQTIGLNPSLSQLLQLNQLS